jgi:DNA-binding GntR family transcriptional regulator
MLEDRKLQRHDREIGGRPVRRAEPGKVTLASRIFTELRREIVSGQLAPGTRIKTLALAERFGVGLSPVREALNRLVSLGLVSQIERRGFSVLEVNQEELADITASRIWLEGMALSKSIERGDTAWEEAVLLSYHRLVRTPGSSIDSPDWNEAHKAFHLTLISACGSDWLLRFCEQLFNAAERYRHLGDLEGGNRANANEEHRLIMQSAIDRNAERSIDFLSAHYTKTQGHLKKVLQRFAKRQL